MKRTVVFTVLFLLLAAVAVPQSHAALSAVGPVDPIKGFPGWYQDANGLTLDLMEAADPHSISAPVEAGNAFSETLGFGA